MQAASVHLEQCSSALTLQCVCARRTVRPPPPLISATLSSLSPCRSEWWPEGWTSVPHRGWETMTSHGSWHHRLWGATGPMPQNVGLRLCSEQIVSVSYLRTCTVVLHMQSRLSCLCFHPYLVFLLYHSTSCYIFTSCTWAVHVEFSTSDCHTSSTHWSLGLIIFIVGGNHIQGLVIVTRCTGTWPSVTISFIVGTSYQNKELL